MLTPQQIQAAAAREGRTYVDPAQKSVSDSWNQLVEQKRQALQTTDTGPHFTETGLLANAPGSTFKSRLGEMAQSGLDVAKGFGKGALGTIKAASNTPILNPSSLISKIPGVPDVIKKTYDPNSIYPSDEQLSSKNEGEKVGKGLEFLAEAAIPIGEGVKIAKPLIEERVAKNLANKTLEVLSPKLSGKKLGEAVAERGTEKTGLLGKISVKVDPYVKKVADTVKSLVPEFNPSKTLSENIGAVKSALSRVGEGLKNQVVQSGKDIIYPFKELSSRMNAIEEPISLKGTPFEKQIGPLKKAALSIAKKVGGTASSLYDAMKEFDVLVEKTYPNLYEKEYSPIRMAVTKIRNTMADFAAEKIPDVAFKETRTQMSHLFSAIDNMAEKAASGTEKEIGKTSIGRYLAKHPTQSRLIKIGGAVATGAAVGDEARKLLPF